MDKSIVSIPGPPLTSNEIAEFENEIGVKLDSDYRNFLSQCNGGPSTRGMLIDGRVCDVTFYSLLPGFEGLRQALFTVAPYVCKCLPIATDTSENEYLLSLKPGNSDVMAAKYIYSDDDDFPLRMQAERIANSFIEFVHILVPSPLNYDAIEKIGATGDSHLIDTYISAGHSIDELGSNGLPIICEAAKYGNDALVAACLARGASPIGAMHLAVRNRQLDVVKTLVKGGVDINERDCAGLTPLDYAGRSYPVEKLNELRKMGAIHTRS